MAFNPFERTPGVFIQEIDVPGPIAGVGTSTAAFIGPAERGPIGRPVKLTNVTQFTNLFGGFVDAPRVYATHAVHGFFRNGGSTCYFQRVGTAVRAHRTLNDRAGQPALVVTALDEGVRRERHHGPGAGDARGRHDGRQGRGEPRGGRERPGDAGDPGRGAGLPRRRHRPAGAGRQQRHRRDRADRAGRHDHLRDPARQRL